MPQDVQAVYLSPPEGQVAFERKEVDALVAWDPFQALVTEKMPVRILTTGEGLTQDLNFYVATRDFARNHYDIVKIAIEEMRQVGIWANEHPSELARMIAANMGLKLSTALKLSERTVFNAQPMQDRAVEEQQRIANIFFRLGLLPKQIWVEDAVWKVGLRN
jgi:sulfonate transport system substrate-binding protein